MVASQTPNRILAQIFNVGISNNPYIVFLSLGFWRMKIQKLRLLVKLRYLLFRSGSKFGLTTSPFNLESTIVLEGYIYNYSSEDFQCPDK